MEKEDFFTKSCPLNSSKLKISLTNSYVKRDGKVLHAMSFNVFIWMEIKFYKIDSFFSLVDHHW
jgi:hypothetical protein